MRYSGTRSRYSLFKDVQHAEAHMQHEQDRLDDTDRKEQRSKCTPYTLRIASLPQHGKTSFTLQLRSSSRRFATSCLGRRYEIMLCCGPCCRYEKRNHMATELRCSCNIPRLPSSTRFVLSKTNRYGVIGASVACGCQPCSPAEVVMIVPLRCTGRMLVFPRVVLVNPGCILVTLCSVKTEKKRATRRCSCRCTSLARLWPAAEEPKGTESKAVFAVHLTEGSYRKPKPIRQETGYHHAGEGVCRCHVGCVRLTYDAIRSPNRETQENQSTWPQNS